MPCYIKRFLSSAIGVFLFGSMSVSAQIIDPHEVYERQCARCHAAHAGDFVSSSLTRSEGVLIGRKSGESLLEFLRAGHGKLTDVEINVLMDHLLKIKTSGRLFQKKCRICHDRAVVLARRKLIINNGVLTGRYTKRNIEQFLSIHGRLNDQQVTKMTGVLTRQLTTKPLE